MLQSKAGYIDARPLPPDRQNSLATHGRTIHSGSNSAIRGQHVGAAITIDCVAKVLLHWSTKNLRAARAAFV